MSDYKQTLLMPTTQFEMKANLSTKEPSIQDTWIKLNIYEKVLQKNSKNQQFILHDGPPYANGNIHVGHALNKIIKDIIVRYKLMQGFYAPIIYGWDTHGLPIENAISKKEKDFEKLSNPIEKRQKCRQYALEQVEIQKKQFARLGLLTNWEKKYLTLEKSFVIDELLLFLEMVKKNLVFQDLKPVYWSWSTRSALADAEIEYHDVTDPSIYIGFSTCENNVIGENVQLLVWTTTPWTILSNLAIAIHPNIEYELVELENKQKVLLAKKLKEKVFAKLSFEKFKVLKTLKGNELENIKYTHPLTKKQNPIILADYVSDEDGTGLVHNAPGFGLDDYYACKKYGIDIYCPIDDFGKFTSEINDSEIEGMFYLSTNPIIIERLKNAGALFKVDNITHSVAHDWRTKKPVMYRATKQWFVNIDAINKDIVNALKDVKSVDQKIIERIKEMVCKRKEWCISRQRVWGVPIPIIYDENMNPIYDINLIHHIINILDNEGIDVWFEKPASYFLLKTMDKNKTYYKEKDIIDVWFDSGSSFNILKHFNLNYPADLYFEGSDQFRGWFNSSLINGVILNNKAPYKFLLQHGFLLDEKGNKMSKSLGNTIDPLKICDTYGADVLRIWTTTNDYSVDIKIGDNIIKQSAEIYRRIRNTLFRYSLSNLNDFDPKQKTSDFEIEDEYVLNCLNESLKTITEAYNKYDFISVIRTVNNFTIELSQWYFDLIKDTLYCDDTNSHRRKQIQTTIYLILEKMLLCLNPIIPHTCEEAYTNFNKLNKQESISLESFPQPIDIKFDASKQTMMKNFFVLKDAIYVELEKARNNELIKKSNEATVIIKDTNGIDPTKLTKWLNVAEVIVDKTTDKITIKNNNYPKCLRCWNHHHKNNMFNDELCIRCNKVINH